MRNLVAVVALCTGCVDAPKKVVFEGEYVDAIDRVVGVGLPVRISVLEDVGTEDEGRLPDSELALIDVSGGTRCLGEPLCVVPDDVERLEVVVETRDGELTGTRTVSRALKLSALTPNWGRAPEDRIHVRANATTTPRFELRDQGDRAVAGHVAGYTTTGPITFVDDEIVAGEPGRATITGTAPAMVPLEIKSITPADSAASIVRFTVDRVWTGGAGRTTLTAYTRGTVGAVLFDGFDADGFLALPGTPLDVIGGPGVEPKPWPGGVGPYSTNSYCFLRGVLPDGVDEMMSFVEVRAGAAVQRFDVKVVRGEY